MLTTFYIPNRVVLVLFNALRQVGQLRISDGPLALKFARITRAVNTTVEDFEQARVRLVNEYAKKDDSGKPVPVYLTDAEGKPVFVKDENGTPTNQKVVKPGEVRIGDTEGFTRALEALHADVSQITMPALREKDLTSLRDAQTETLTALLDLLDDSPYLTAPRRPAEEASAA